MQGGYQGGQVAAAVPQVLWVLSLPKHLEEKLDETRSNGKKDLGLQRVPWSLPGLRRERDAKKDQTIELKYCNE